MTLQEILNKVPELSKSRTAEICYHLHVDLLAEKFSEYDAFYFSAEKRHSNSEKEFESKKEIYLLAGNKAKKRSGALLYEREDSHGAYWLLSKIKLSDESLENIKMSNPLKEALIAVGITGKFADSQ